MLLQQQLGLIALCEYVAGNVVITQVLLQGYVQESARAPSQSLTRTRVQSNQVVCPTLHVCTALANVYVQVQCTCVIHGLGRDMFSFRSSRQS